MPTMVLIVALAVFSDLYASSNTRSIGDAENLGTCSGSNGSVNLSRAMFLENRLLDWNGRSGPIRITLHRQSVNIRMLEAPHGDAYVRDIGSIVAQGEDRADIYLKIALLDNVPVIYWRETYQHRMYRQGIFSIAGHDLIRLCEGLGGETILD